MGESEKEASKLTRAQANRLGWALKETGHGVVAALHRDRSHLADSFRSQDAATQAEALTRLIMEQADPTSNKRFTAWLAREYAAGRLILEDLGTANWTLSLFLRYAPRLKPEQRDIQRYGSLAAAWEAVRGFAEREEAHSNKAQKALDRARAYEESRILRQDPDGFTVAVPLTEFASKWWGRGTRWCTAAENGNQFWYYQKESPLLTLIIPEVGKFQIWSSSDEFQFMDASDSPVTDDEIIRHWNYLSSIFVALIAENGLTLQDVPTSLRSEELCLLAVKQNGEALDYVPRAFRTAQLCRIAVEQNGKALEYVPKTLRTEEICEIAVRQDAHAMPWVPKRLRNRSICKTAVSQVGMKLGDVPNHLRDEEMCLLAITQNGRAVQHVPKPLLNERLCRLAVMQNGWALGSIPKEMRTEDMCWIAVSQEGTAIACVPDDLKTEELYSLAIGQNATSLSLVPEERRTEEMCRLAVSRDGTTLGYVPGFLRTEELCRIAVEQNGWALEWVPKHLRTDEIYEIAVRNTPEVVIWLPMDLREKLKLSDSSAARTPRWQPDMLDRLEKALDPKLLRCEEPEMPS